MSMSHELVCTGFRSIVASMLLLLAGCAAPQVDLPAFVELDFAKGGYTLPARPVIVFFVDGLHKATFQEMVAAGEMPLTKKYLLDRAAEIENAVTGVPSCTYANAASMITGAFPPHNGALGFRWFDAERLIYRNYETIATMGQVNPDLTAPTIYEMLPDKFTACIFNQVNRGVKAPIDVYPIEGGKQSGLAYGLGCLELTDHLLARRFYEVGQYAKAAGQWPDLLQSYFVAPDNVAHMVGHRTEAYRAALRNLDACLGTLLRVLDEQGVLDQMTVVLISDHGHVQSEPHQHFDVARFLHKRLGISVADEQLDEYTDFGTRTRTYDKHRAVVVVDGERNTRLHLRAGDRWGPRPALDEVLGFHNACGKPADPADRAGNFAEILLREPAINHVVVRSGEGEVFVFGKCGRARIRRSLTPDGPYYSYEVVRGDDPLRYDAHPAAGKLRGSIAHSSREWLNATAASDHPDMVPQLVALFDTRRAGDVSLFAAPGWDFSDVHRGNHGGIEREEMIIPFYIAGPGIKPGTKVRAGRVADLVPTVLDLMGLAKRVPEGTRFDGVSLAPELLAR